MNLRELRQHGRKESADDRATPPLFSNEEWKDALNDAINEACIRARLIENEEIALRNGAGSRRYAVIPDHVWRIENVRFNGRKLLLVDKTMLDASEGEQWEERTADVPIACYEISGKLRFYPIPDTVGDIRVHGFCTPEKPLEDDDDEPESIRSRLHVKLIDWALHCLYSKKDADLYDGVQADKYEAAFERTFGPRPDEKAMRRLRINVKHRTRGAYF